MQTVPESKVETPWPRPIAKRTAGFVCMHRYCMERIWRRQVWLSFARVTCSTYHATALTAIRGRTCASTAGTQVTVHMRMCIPDRALMTTAWVLQNLRQCRNSFCSGELAQKAWLQVMQSGDRHALSYHLVAVCQSFRPQRTKGRDWAIRECRFRSCSITSRWQWCIAHA